MNASHCSTTAGEASCPIVNEPVKTALAVHAGVGADVPVEPKLVLVTLGDIASARNALSSAIDKIADPSVRLTPNRENNNFISVFLCCQRATNLSSRLVNSKSHATRAGASDLFRAGRKFVIEARRKFDCCRLRLYAGFGRTRQAFPANTVRRFAILALWIN